MTAVPDPSVAGVIRTTCPYCGVGCGVDATPTRLAEEPPLHPVAGTTQHPANRGRLCVKGSALHEAVGQGNRLLHPEVNGRRTSWDDALDLVATTFRDTIATHGPDAVAFYLSGQLLTEDYYVANKLMKGFFGSANVDTNSRLCMASAVAGYKRAFGADAVPCCYEDLELCDLIVITGSNAAWAHPVLFQRIAAAREARPALKVVVIDPRRTATCDIADQFLGLRPGSDAFLFNGLVYWLLHHGHADEAYLAAHCNGLDALVDTVSACTPAVVSQATGIAVADLEAFYRLFAATERSVTFYSQGINQSATGTDKCNAIINCHLVTGRIGKPGMGPFSITGQPNAMGGREVGGLANQLAAHMDFSDETVDRVGRFWQAPSMAQRPGLKAVDMFRAVREGTIKALWIMGTNPAVSLPESDEVRAALRDCPFVVVSDCVRHTDTTAFADVLLPATGWSEKDGTVTNSERCISRQRALLIPAGEARHDWQILTDVAHRLGHADQFPYTCPRDVFVEHAALSGFENDGSRAFDISALATLDVAQYEALEPVQWPVTHSAPRGTTRLFADGRFFTADGRANLVPVMAKVPDVRTSDAYPLLLNSGRLRDQWHTMTRTGQVPRLLQHSPHPFVAMAPARLAALAVQPGELVHVRSPHGELLLPVQPDAGLRDDDVFVPIHWNDRFASNARVSRLFGARVDPYSGQPESKFEPVAVSAAPMRQWVALVVRHELGQEHGEAGAATQRLTPEAFSYWDKRPVPGGWCYRLATNTPFDIDALRSLLCALPRLRWLEFEDADRGEVRLAALAGSTLVGALYSGASARELPAAGWLQQLLARTRPAQVWKVLAGRDNDGVEKGAIVCSCHDVGRDEILAAIRSGADSTQALGRQLRCGTGCGSCIPELRQLLAQAREHASPATAPEPLDLMAQR